MCKVVETCPTSTHLPPEIWCKIIENLHNVRDLKNMTCLSRLYYQLASMKLWRVTRLQKGGADALADITHLPIVELYMLNSGCQDHHLDVINKMTHIKKLVLHYNADITDTGLSMISKLANLNYLAASYSYNLTPLGIQSMSSLPLQELRLWNSGINDSHLAVIKNITSIKKLVLGANTDITDKGLSHIAKLTQLRHLNINYCLRITPAGLSSLAQLLPLKELCLQYGDVNAAHVSVLSTMKTLTKLDLMANFNLTDTGVLQLYRGLTDLTYLDVRMSLVSPECMAQLDSQSPGVLIQQTVSDIPLTEYNDMYH